MELTFIIAVVLSIQASPDWSSVDTPHFAVLYPPRSERRLKTLIPLLEPELSRVSNMLDAEPPEKITVVMTPDLRAFSDLQGGAVPPWVSGTAYPERSLIYLRPLTGQEIRHSSLRAVVAHEITHVVLHKKLGARPPPRWLDEGLCVFMANEPLYSRAERLITIGLTGRYIPFRRLEHGFPNTSHASASAYAQSGDFVRFLYFEYGDQAFREYLQLMAGGEDPDQALSKAFNTTLFDLETEWAKSVRRTYGLIPAMSGGTLLWFLISLLAIAAYLKKRAQARAMRERMMEEDYLGPRAGSRAGPGGVFGEGRLDEDGELDGESPPDDYTLH